MFILDWILLDGKDFLANSLRKHLEEGYGVVDPLEIVWDVPPYVEEATLFWLTEGENPWDIACSAALKSVAT